MWRTSFHGWGWVNNLNGWNTKMERVSKQLDKFPEGIINDHIESRSAAAGCVDEDDQMDLIDVLLDVQKDGSKGVSIGRDTIKAIVLDIFGGGTETTFTALEWIMTELIRHPKAMTRVREEIRETARHKDNKTADDLRKMNHLKAVIKETLRLYPAVPSLVPRTPSQDVKVHGYDILAKTRVIINGWTIGRDPAYWRKPEKFKPKRFRRCSIDFERTRH